MISIITVNLNNRDGLRLTAESIAAQSDRSYEWIVIDGGSTDGSTEVINQYADHITYWASESDTGIYNAMNKGIGHATGEYILFLNSGDRLYDADTVSTIMPIIGKNDFEVFDILIDGTDRRYAKDLSALAYTPVLYYLYKDTFPHQSTLIRRELFEHAGLYDEHLKIVSDWEFCLRAFINFDVSYAYHHKTLSVYDTTGVSSVNGQALEDERHTVLSQVFSPSSMQILSDGYRDNVMRHILTKNKTRRFILKALLKLYQR